MASSTKTLIYKSAEFFGDPTDRTLQSMVESALRKKKAAFNRRQPSDASNQCFRLINYHGRHRGIRVGELLDYTKGHVQPFTTINQGDESLELNALRPPESKNGDSEFIHSILYFGLFGNHVVLAQSMGLRVQQLEDYINWVLHETEQLTDEQFVALTDQVPADLQDEISQTNGVTFNAPIQFGSMENGKEAKDVEPASRVTVPEGNTKSIRFSPQGGGWAAIKNFLPPEFELPESLSVDDIVQNRELVVKLELSWKRARKDDSSTLLDSISNQLRHVDTELDYEIRTKSGQRISKDEIKLSQAISVPINDSGLPKREEVWPQMSEWITQLIEQQRILAD